MNPALMIGLLAAFILRRPGAEYPLVDYLVDKGVLISPPSSPEELREELIRRIHEFPEGAAQEALRLAAAQDAALAAEYARTAYGFHQAAVRMAVAMGATALEDAVALIYNIGYGWEAVAAIVENAAEAQGCRRRREWCQLGARAFGAMRRAGMDPRTAARTLFRAVPFDAAVRILRQAGLSRPVMAEAFGEAFASIVMDGEGGEQGMEAAE